METCPFCRASFERICHTQVTCLRPACQRALNNYRQKRWYHRKRGLPAPELPIVESREQRIRRIAELYR